MNKEIIKEKLTTLLSGFPEIRIIQLVRRSHSVKVCPHKGNCLTEKEMVSKLHCLLVDLLKAQKEEIKTQLQYAINDKKTLKRVENLPALK